MILYDFFKSELLKRYIFQSLSISSDTFPGHKPSCCKDVQDIYSGYGITNSVDLNLSKFQEILRDREAWRATDHGVAKSQIRLSN